jgi:hypothetical protein
VPWTFDMLLTRHVVKQLEVFEWGEDDKKYMREWGEKRFPQYCLKHTWRDEFVGLWSCGEAESLTLTILPN